MIMDLFTKKNSADIDTAAPLADRVRPTTINTFFGHSEYLDKGKLIHKLLKNHGVLSVILWGPPGTGKTTLARILAKNAGADFLQISAVDSGVKELREIIKLGEANKLNGMTTVLFIDEIHRFNKAQQDGLLSAVEKGTLTLMGATTENPSFEVISPLLSRTRVIRLNSLSDQDMKSILNNALSNDPQLAAFKPTLEQKAVKLLIESSNGDARRMLNTLELSIRLVGRNANIYTNIVSEALLTRTPQYDKKGENHYDLISAFIKSVRGSDPDAAVYWLARMLDGGEDPKFIARRMIILASEDIGNADPLGIVLANSTFSAVEKIGMPEAQIVLSQAATYLAGSPKSNAAYLAIDKAFNEIRTGKEYPVPLHLRNAPTKLMKEEGYSEGYIYPHDSPDHFAEQEYLPPELSKKIFYEPSEEGRERIIAERLALLWNKRKR